VAHTTAIQVLRRLITPRRVIYYDAGHLLGCHIDGNNGYIWVLRIEIELLPDGNMVTEQNALNLMALKKIIRLLQVIAELNTADEEQGVLTTR